MDYFDIWGNCKLMSGLCRNTKGIADNFYISRWINDPVIGVLWIVDPQKIMKDIANE